jgi:hypothetical protein
LEDGAGVGGQSALSEIVPFRPKILEAQFAVLVDVQPCRPKNLGRKSQLGVAVEEQLGQFGESEERVRQGDELVVI